VHPKAANGVMIEGTEEWDGVEGARSAGRLAGRVALVTGAGQGIGRAIALKPAAEGAAVLANDLDADRLAALRAEVAGAGGRSFKVGVDVAQTELSLRRRRRAGRRAGQRAGRSRRQFALLNPVYPLRRIFTFWKHGRETTRPRFGRTPRNGD